MGGKARREPGELGCRIEGMRSSGFWLALAGVVCSGAAAGAQTAADAPVSVMVVAGFHMANPSHDMHNVQVPDVLEAKPQAEIAAVTEALSRFGPTAVMVEWPADVTSERYAKYMAGTLPPSRNEVVQLGFRLAKTAGLRQVYGIDVDGQFPYEPVQTFAQAHGQTAILERANAAIEATVAAETELLKTKGIAATLRYLNEPE